MHRGFITLHRKIVDWEWYSDANVFRVFTHLILTANWEPKKWQGILVERGQRITSIQHIAEETGLTPQSVRTAISKLKLTGELTSQSTNKYTIVTLTNYDFYQTIENEVTSKITSNLTNEQQTNNKQLTTTKPLLNNITIKTNKEKSPADFEKSEEGILSFDNNGLPPELDKFTGKTFADYGVKPQDIQNALGQPTMAVKESERPLILALLSEGCEPIDFKEALNTTIKEGKAVRSVKYLQSRIRDARDMRKAGTLGNKPMTDQEIYAENVRIDALRTLGYNV